MYHEGCMNMQQHERRMQHNSNVSIAAVCTVVLLLLMQSQHSNVVQVFMHVHFVIYNCCFVHAFELYEAFNACSHTS
jgi:hypothetical protein